MRLGIAILLFALSGITQAEDVRIKTEIYDANRVYAVHTAVGRATLIQLEQDESLSMTPNAVLGIGDAHAWNLGVRGNNIVLKPTKKLPQTNIVIVTNKRTYSLDLKGTRKHQPPTYILRFYYPDTEALRIEQERKRAAITAHAKASPITINTDYVWRGDNPALKPTAAYDDGRFTYLIYDNSAELPVFFKKLPDGSESLMNSHIDGNRGNTVVLHEVIRTIKARLGKEVIEITNKNYIAPAFNQNKTGVHGAVRVTKEPQ